jgi:translation elongation factor EF-Ts
MMTCFEIAVKVSLKRTAAKLTTFAEETISKEQISRLVKILQEKHERTGKPMPMYYAYLV